MYEPVKAFMYVHSTDDEYVHSELVGEQLSAVESETLKVDFDNFLSPRILVEEISNEPAVSSNLSQPQSGPSSLHNQAQNFSSVPTGSYSNIEIYLFKCIN